MIKAPAFIIETDASIFILQQKHTSNEIPYKMFFLFIPAFAQGAFLKDSRSPRGGERRSNQIISYLALFVVL